MNAPELQHLAVVEKLSSSFWHIVFFPLASLIIYIIICDQFLLVRMSRGNKQHHDVVKPTDVDGFLTLGEDDDDASQNKLNFSYTQHHLVSNIMSCARFANK